MLKKLILENWKSFRYAELPIDPLTILIGANASGKSNALEALSVLHALADGMSVGQALDGGEGTTGVRGGVEWSKRQSSNQTFCLKATLAEKQKNADYLYQIEVSTHSKVHVSSESLCFKSTNNSEEAEILFKARFLEHPEKENGPEQAFPGAGVTVSFSDGNLGRSMISIKSDISALVPMSGLYIGQSTNESAKFVRRAFQGVKVVLPVPAIMRGFSKFSEKLHQDASNIAGYIAALSDVEKQRVEKTLTSYTRELSGQDIQKVWAEPVGRSSRDAMLYGEEVWGNGESTEIDARSMSDGTLRFIAILTALLTAKNGSQLIIEDVDDGLHPSRAQLLLKALKEIGEQRQVDVLVTTHNPALLDSLEQDYLPFVVVVHRDPNTGESLLTPLDKIENLPKLLASDSLGDLVTKGAIERNLEIEAIAP